MCTFLYIRYFYIIQKLTTNIQSFFMVDNSYSYRPGYDVAVFSGRVCVLCGQQGPTGGLQIRQISFEQAPLFGRATQFSKPA